MTTQFTVNLDGTDYKVVADGNTLIVNDHPFVVGFEGEAVTVNGIAYDITLDGDQVVVDGIVHKFSVAGLDKRESEPRAAKPPPASSGAGSIRAIMPGTIVRVFVDEGDTVDEGDVVIVLEAMKMENELRAPTSGVVKNVYVAGGQTVEMNAVLAEIEAV
jgi:biotin carboxyl carrier protein